MGIFDRIFKKKNKEKQITFNIMGKDYSVDLSEDAIKKREEGYDREKHVANRKRLDDLSKKQKSTRSFFDVEIPFYSCLDSLHELKRPYFTYLKHIDKLRNNLRKIAGLPINDHYENGKNRAIKKAINDIDEFKLEIDEKRLFDDPKRFLLELNDFHKEVLLRSVEPLYNYWVTVVSKLKQKPAKRKRQQYVIDGFITLKNELLSVTKAKSDIKIVDEMIEKIKKENWESL